MCPLKSIDDQREFFHQDGIGGDIGNEMPMKSLECSKPFDNIMPNDRITPKVITETKAGKSRNIELLRKAI